MHRQRSIARVKVLRSPDGPQGRDHSHVALAAARALANPQFQRLLAPQTVSRWGDTFNSVALVILVYRLTGSGLQVAATVAFEIAPALLFGFIAGAVVDRRPRRQVMIAADLGRVLVALVLSAFGGQLAVLYAGAFLLSTFSVFFNPAAASVLPAIVDDDLVGANSAVWSAAVISQIVLAPVAGALVAVPAPPRRSSSTPRRSQCPAPCCGGWLSQPGDASSFQAPGRRGRAPPRHPGPAGSSPSGVPSRARSRLRSSRW